ncbi:MAG TPA: hypothetical protein DCY35_06235 [Prolixibacteraceae bacterium]|nr:hypothetical protein [Prolixibacteraceae bacterium]
MAHKSHNGHLFYAGFTSDLALRLSQHLGVKPGEIRKTLRMYIPTAIPPRALDQTDSVELERRFGKYFEGEARPSGSYLDDKGILHTPGSLYHFTHFVSPLRNAETLEEIEAFIYYPGYKGYDESGMKEQVNDAHAEGRVVRSPTHILEPEVPIDNILAFCEACREYID